MSSIGLIYLLLSVLYWLDLPVAECPKSSASDEEDEEAGVEDRAEAGGEQEEDNDSNVRPRHVVHIFNKNRSQREFKTSASNGISRMR